MKTINIDISDLYRTRGRTGIQRVVREVVSRIIVPSDGFTVRVLRFDAQLGRFHVLRADAVAAFLIDDGASLDSDSEIGFDDLGADDVFLDLDSAWNSPLKRPALYARLKSVGATIVTMVYDLIPLEMPQFVHPNTLRNWTLFMSAVYAYSDIVLLDSRSAEVDFAKHKDASGVVRHIPTVVVQLGADFTVAAVPTPEELEGTARFLDRQFVLFVSTVEPRKMHAAAIDAMDYIHHVRPDAHLVFVGRQGWHSDDIVEKMQQHPLWGRRIHWVGNASDALLERLYEKASASLYLSHGEGYGLPVAEALAHGRVTVASDNSSIFEVGGRYADYVHFNSPAEIAESLLNYLSHDNLRAAREAQIRDEYIPFSWDRAASSIRRVLTGLDRAAEISRRPLPNALQWVFISNVPESLARTIPLLEKHVSWLRQIVVITPGFLADEIRAIPSQVPIHVIEEEGILGDRLAEFRDADHQRKNWMLRSSLVDLDEIDDQFVMLDDDNQPLADIPMDVFLREQPRYRGYFFYDIARWAHNRTEYDSGQHETKRYLDSQDLELLSYSSHQPQIIDKELFREAITAAYTAVPDGSIDEWSSYFNYVASYYPTLIEKRRFLTLNWPGTPSAWNWRYEPAQYLFENYYKSIYDTDDALAAGVDASSSAEQKVEFRAAQAAPWIRSARMLAETAPLIHSLDLAHGGMYFASADGAFVVAGIPHIITVVEGAPVLHRMTYVRTGGVETELCYRIAGVENSYGRTFGPASDHLQQSENGIAELVIPFTPLPAGVYNIEFFARIAGENVFMPNTVYRSKLVVVRPDATLAEAWSQL